LTGGLGSGKSTVEHLCREQGIPTADADRWAHEILEHDREVKQRVVEYFQAEFDHTPLLPDGRVDRGYIASEAFHAPRVLAFLEHLIHPRVKEMAGRWIREQREQGVPVAVMIVPLLLESRMDKDCDLVVALAASEEIRVKRLEESRGWTEQECRARMNRQIDDRERSRRADILLTNEGTRQELADSLQGLLQNVGSLLEKKNRNMNQ
jgi:dephospho-CoA kinase